MAMREGTKKIDIYAPDNNLLNAMQRAKKWWVRSRPLETGGAARNLICQWKCFSDIKEATLQICFSQWGEEERQIGKTELALFHKDRQRKVNSSRESEIMAFSLYWDRLLEFLKFEFPSVRWKKERRQRDRVSSLVQKFFPCVREFCSGTFLIKFHPSK